MNPDDLLESWITTPEIRMVVGASGVIESANPAAQSLGLTPAVDVRSLAAGPARRKIARLLNRAGTQGRSAVAEVALELCGRDHVCLVQAIPLGEGRLELAGRDVTRIRNREQSARDRSGRDALTGLPGRAVLHDRLGQAVRRAQRAGHGVGLMYLDVDDFKDVNDRFGHAFGDEVLQGVAQRVLGVLRSSDTMARLGGDEFVVVCEGMADAAALDALAARVAAAVTVSPFVGDSASASVSCSVGVAYANPEGLDVELFLRAADSAMYEAKRRGPGHRRSVTVERQSERMTGGIQRAIERGTLPMAVQAIRDQQTGALSGRALDVALQSRPRTAAALHALASEPAAMRSYARLAVRQAIRVARGDDSGSVQVHIPLIALADAKVREALLAEIAGSGVSADRFVFAVDAQGVRSERTLLSVQEAMGARLRLALLRFGTESLDIGALTELQPEVCELDAGLVAGNGPRTGERVGATCAVAHAVGARTQVRGLDLAARLKGIDQVRAPIGEPLQRLEPLPMER